MLVLVAHLEIPTEVLGAQPHLLARIISYCCVRIMYISIYLYLSLSMYMYVYIYIYIEKYIVTNMYMHMHISYYSRL